LQVLRASDFLDVIRQDGLVQTLAEGIRTHSQQRIRLKNLSGSLDSAVFSAVQKVGHCSHLIILHDKEEASYWLNDLQQMLSQKESLLFPMSYKRPYEYEEIENANVLMRAEALDKISQHPDSQIIVTYPEALSEKVITKKSLATNTFIIKKGEKLDRSFLEEFLHTYDFEKADFVYEAGQFSVRGGIIDVFSYAHEMPMRIELFGDEVEEIRTFDPGSQLSIQLLDQVRIIPDVQTKLVHEERQSLLEFIPPNARIWVKDFAHAQDLLATCFDKVQSGFDKISLRGTVPIVGLSPDKLFVSVDEFSRAVEKFQIIEFGSKSHFKNSHVIEFRSGAQPVFNKNFDLLATDLFDRQMEGYACLIASDQPRQLERLREIFQEIQPLLKFQPLDFTMREGFVDHFSKILCYTDHQIFERFYRYRAKEKFSKSKAITFRELQTLQPGDFVTHIDFGIAKFAGLEKKEVDGKQQESIRLVFRDNDLLYLNIHALHKISKYSGKEGTPPIMSKLGSDEWDVRKSKIKRQVKDIARDLIKLYARRKQTQGFAFSPDSFLQAELESSFLYDDTPDQAKATEDVKKDMEIPHPMDRLVCGDVGFGKTEVAVRAAFKAVSDGKQVAVLVPTTILAMQHHRTFSERLANFPVKVEYVSRFKSTKEIKKSIAELKEGNVNIMIGTHRIVSKDVEFKNLGLLIVDEEQKFGVKTKDRLKELKVNVDVLTLTATPIPRTLHFSLMAARDLSIIATPPPNRQPVTTELHTFDEIIIRDAVVKELKRGGQVFFVHNRVSDIDAVANMIYKLVPDSRIGIAHGQMEGDQLEKVMVHFIEGEYDVLVSTNIIESGLDIPNANTIIINQAHMFGLSDLHQMRGRVGRSNKKAYCIMLTPPTKVLSADSRKRLAALEEFSELGDGFKVAMRDLDIRGAGNLLGAEQSGFINDLGYETYHKILDDAVQELKEEEFKDLFAVELAEKAKLIVQDCVIETDLEILIPETYVNNISERLQLYSTLDNIKNDEALNAFRDSLRDRFGELPNSVEQLINSVRLRWIGEELGFEKISLKGGRMRGYFITSNDAYFNSEVFGRILAFIQLNKKCRLKDSSGKPMLVIEDIESVNAAMELLTPLLKNQRPKEAKETLSI
jgi:transcription-repair coupling factor (superfamily II helicase)